MWTDLGGQQGAAINFGNGTAWNGNSFNNRVSDLSNYTTMSVRISATDPTDSGGDLGLNAFMNTNNFSFQSVEGGAGRNIPIDGRFHTVTWTLDGTIAHRNAVDAVGINLFGHAQDLEIRVDWIHFNVPEPATASLVVMAFAGCLGLIRRRQRT